MIIEHIKAADLKTNNWSGGTTTQLVIYPKDSDYKKQNFLFRLSTASVESEESTFTKLPSISRKLMILDGEIKIEHKNQHSKILKKFEQDEFSGDWNTKSYGKAVDFNLMTKGNTTGEIEAISLYQSLDINLKSDFDCYGFYLYSGKLKLQVNLETYSLSKGDFVTILSEKSDCEIKVLTKSFGELILTKIRL
jgi:environmental stress-induced protein Ves